MRNCLILTMLVVAIGLVDAEGQQYAHSDYFYHRDRNSIISCAFVSYNEKVSILSTDMILMRQVCIDQNGQYAPDPGENVYVVGKSDRFNKFLRPMAFPPAAQEMVGYELRSKRLIPIYILSISGRRIPIKGKKIVEFDKYHYSETSSVIYNFPGTFVNPDRKIISSRPPLPRLTLTINPDDEVSPSKFSLSSITYFYSSRERHGVYHRMGEYLYCGKYDEHGVFLWNASVPPKEIKHISKEEIMGLIRLAIIDEPVYEFRSGMLVPGHIDKDYYFVPESGAQIKSLSEYEYPSDTRRIYNLPGVILNKN